MARLFLKLKIKYPYSNSSLTRLTRFDVNLALAKPILDNNGPMVFFMLYMD